MMKVYQPLCPDTTFRLVADLSPDTLEESEDSTLSSRSADSTPDEEELKLKLYEETQPNSHHTDHLHNTRFTSTPASPVCSKSARNIRQQDYLSNGATPFLSAAVTSRLSTQCTVSKPVSVEKPSHGTDQYSHDELGSCQGLNLTNTVDRYTSSEQPYVCHTQIQQSENNLSVTIHHIKPNAEQGDLPDPPDDQQPSCSHQSENIDQQVNNRPPSHESNDDIHNDDSDDDCDSIEDVSISHNVPMRPPSPEILSSHCSPNSPRKVMVPKAEVTRDSTCSPSHCDGSTRVKSSPLRLNIPTKTVSKCPSPYTLACDITPSPMLENVTMASTLSSEYANTDPNTNTSITTSSAASRDDSSPLHTVQCQHRESPEIQRKHHGLRSASSQGRSIFDEIQEALIREVSGEEVEPPSTEVDAAQQYPFIHKHMGHLFDKKRLLIGYATAASSRARHRGVSSSPCSSRDTSASRSRNISMCSVASEAGAAAAEEDARAGKMEDSPSSDSEEEASVIKVEDGLNSEDCSASVVYGQARRRKNSDGDGSKRHSSSTMSTPYSDLEVTHRGMHRFIPRHADEVQIGIGDPIHVVKEFDDLWCEGVNLRSGERGLFPAMYANDLTFLEESDGDDEHWKFTMRFLGTVEVTSSSGDFALCQAINKVAQQGRIKTASLCTLEINQYGIRMIDKSKEGHESEKFTNFFALKNISFCGTHPNNNRYFAFITKHPRELRFACHVFHSERSTHRARDALGDAFKRFYQEYMAFTHPTEDIWIE